MFVVTCLCFLSSSHCVLGLASLQNYCFFFENKIVDNEMVESLSEVLL